MHEKKVTNPFLSDLLLSVDWERRVSNLFVQNLERFDGIGYD